MASFAATSVTGAVSASGAPRKQLPFIIAAVFASVLLVWYFFLIPLIIPADELATKPVAFLSQQCASLGYTSRNLTTATASSVGGSHSNFVSEKHAQLQKFNVHTFRFYPPHHNLFLCVPSKNGNRNWGALFYRQWFQQVPVNGDAVTSSMHRFQNQIFQEGRDHIWMVSRSPYVRLLSIYIEKVLCLSHCSSHQYLEGFAHFKPLGNITFERFVDEVYEIVLRGRDPQRVLPIQRAVELCHLDHHFCIQSACLFKLRDSPVRILRLEEQGQWFGNFTRCMGVAADSIISEDWLPFSGKGCYYTPTQSCDDALSEERTERLAVGAVHGKGAAEKLQQYYSLRAAKRVSYLYEYDLDVLGYRTWDGSHGNRSSLISSSS